MLIHLLGNISALLVFLSLLGLLDQIRLIFIRDNSNHENASKSISLVYNAVSYLAFLTMFMYGNTLGEASPYLVYPRFFACILCLIILSQLVKVNKSTISVIIWIILFAMFLVSCYLSAKGLNLLNTNKQLIKELSVLVSISLMVGNIDQIIKIHTCPNRTNVSMLMHTIYFFKDSFTAALGIAIGLTSGWPLVVMFGSNAILKAVIIASICRGRSKLPFAKE